VAGRYASHLNDTHPQQRPVRYRARIALQSAVTVASSVTIVAVVAVVAAHCTAAAQIPIAQRPY